MREFVIEPHVGIGPIRLGMTRAEVHETLGKPEFTHADRKREEYLGGFMADYNAQGKVESIEIAESERFRGVFEGECLHELPAEQAVAHLTQFDDYDPNDPELGYSYTFIGLQMALWRGIVPEPDQDPDDDTGRFFEAVSVAEEGYFEAYAEKASNR